MGKPDDEAALRELKAARADLDKVYRDEIKAAKRAGRKLEETPAYWKANNRVAEAEKSVSWWRR